MKKMGKEGRQLCLTALTASMYIHIYMCVYMCVLCNVLVLVSVMLPSLFVLFAIALYIILYNIMDLKYFRESGFQVSCELQAASCKLHP